MVTKSNEFEAPRRYPVSRVLLFCLCVLLCTASVVAGLAGLAQLERRHGSAASPFSMISEDVIAHKDFRESEALYQEIRRDMEDILYLAAKKGDEAAIERGDFVDQQDLKWNIRSYFEQEQARAEHGAGEPAPEDGQTEEALFAQFVKEHAAEIESIRQRMGIEQLRGYRDIADRLREQEGLLYGAFGGQAISNLPAGAGSESPDDRAAAIKSQPIWLIYENDRLTIQTDQKQAPGMRHPFAAGLENWLRDFYQPGITLYMAYDQNYLDKQSAVYRAMLDTFWTWVPLTLALALAGLILMLFLCLTTGSRRRADFAEADDPAEALRQWDRSFWLSRRSTEFRLVGLGTAVLLGGYLFGLVAIYGRTGTSNGSLLHLSASAPEALLHLIPAGFVGLFFGSLALAFLLSIARSIRYGRFFADSLLLRLLRFLLMRPLRSVGEGLQAFYHCGSLMRKVVFWTVVFCFVAATRYLLPLLLLAVIILVPRLVKKFERIKKGVAEVAAGNLEHTIPVDGKTELDQLAAGINRISSATQVAVRNELKNQRLKADLISNVSHDLKTPLTSIITYVDLLRQEGANSPNAAKYLDVLADKSQRLKKLTDDLFDAAKASSGAMPIQLERVDLLSLVNQGLGEMEAGFAKVDLDVRLSAEPGEYHIQADGQLMWRVIENLLGNVQKYALPGSRVYVELSKIAGANGNEGRAAQAVLSIKNISQQELNMAPDELLERFKRGDEARGGEGSGLGLAIAKDLVRLQGGWLEIRIDGDLFKTVVMMPAIARVEPESAGESQPAD